MKRYISIICSCLLAFGLLVGCSNDASTEGNTSTNTSETRATNSAAMDPAAVETLEKAIDELNKINGLSFKDHFSVTAKVEDITSTTKGKLKGQVTFSPYKAKTSGKVTEDEYEYAFKTYEDEKHQYVYDPDTKKWEKFELDKKSYDFQNDLTEFLNYLNMENSKEWIQFTQNGDTSTYHFQFDKVKDEELKKKLLMDFEEKVFGFEEGIIKEDLEDLDDLEGLDLSEFEDVVLPELEDIEDKVLPKFDFDLPTIKMENLNMKLTLKNSKPMLDKISVQFTMSAGELITMSIEQEITITDLFEGKIKLPKAKERKDPK